MINPADHLGLAQHWARKFWKRFKGRLAQRADYEDVLQECLLGMCKAAQNYDPEKGASFATYAESMCRGYMLSLYYANRRLVRFSSKETNRLAVRLVGDNAELPDLAEATAAMEYKQQLTEEELHRLVGYSVGYEFDIEQKDANGRSVLDITPDPDATEQTEANNGILLRTVLAAIEKNAPASRVARYKELVQYRLLTDDPTELQVLADEWGITRQRVHQLDQDLRALLLAELFNRTI